MRPCLQISVFLLMFSALGTSGIAREPLGVFGSWGAFRDEKPRRCYAIAEPEPRRQQDGWRPFASVALWPDRQRESQLHVRLRKNRTPGTPVILVIGDARFVLVAGKADAWASDARTDAAIVRAMRSGTQLTVFARSDKGQRFLDSYPLRGAATAIDAAMVACARRR